jgi:hypothetical protein
MQRLIAAALVTAGILVLVGPGWALVSAGALVLLLDDRSLQWLADRRDQAQALGRRLAAVPRRSLSATSMGVGLVAVPAGATMAVGTGVGLLALGGLLIGFSLLFGEGA